MSLSRLASQQVARNVAGSIHASSATAAPDKDDRFDLLTKYIPTETLTLYVAAMAALPAITDTFPNIKALQLYIAGAVLTPVILLLAGYGKQRAAGSTAAFRPHPWPLFASLVAYLVWALSVPGLLDGKNAQILAGFGAVLVSTLLSMLEPAFGPRKPAA